jgi:hypothetical protein
VSCDWLKNCVTRNGMVGGGAFCIDGRGRCSGDLREHYGVVMIRLGLTGVMRGSSFGVVGIGQIRNGNVGLGGRRGQLESGVGFGQRWPEVWSCPDETFCLGVVIPRLQSGRCSCGTTTTS